MIILTKNPKKVEEIIDLITELKGDELEALWEWFNSKAIVGDMLVDFD